MAAFLRQGECYVVAPLLNFSKFIIQEFGAEIKFWREGNFVKHYPGVGWRRVVGQSSKFYSVRQFRFWTSWEFVSRARSQIVHKLISP